MVRIPYAWVLQEFSSVLGLLSSLKPSLPSVLWVATALLLIEPFSPVDWRHTHRL
jgi:hypothetical protein